MKAPAQPSHHEAKPRRETGIGYSQPMIDVDTSIGKMLSTRDDSESRSTFCSDNSEIIIETSRCQQVSGRFSYNRLKRN